LGNLREGEFWGDPGVDGIKILKWIFRMEEWGYGLYLAGSV
jgi:hypothetical protein